MDEFAYEFLNSHYESADHDGHTLKPENENDSNIGRDRDETPSADSGSAASGSGPKRGSIRKGIFKAANLQDKLLEK